MHIIAAHSVHYVILLHSYIVTMLTLNQPLTHKCVQSLNKSIRRIYMGVIILGANTSYINFCFFKQIPTALRTHFEFCCCHCVTFYYRVFLPPGCESWLYLSQLHHHSQRSHALRDHVGHSTEGEPGVAEEGFELGQVYRHGQSRSCPLGRCCMSNS